MDPLGHCVAAGRPNLVFGHQMPASKALGQPSYTTAINIIYLVFVLQHD